MQSLIASIRIVVMTMLICVVGYAAVIWALAQILTPDTANGSLITNADGKIVGSRLIAQKFEQPRYFWPRPSSAGKAGYDATSAAGSNKSPTSDDVKNRAVEIVAKYGATPENPLPAELAAASGGGLDPHISVRAALYQVERVAQARGLPRPRIEALIQDRAFSPGAFFTPDRLVNVLELNLALDQLGGGNAISATQ
jgi:K+-transporting ATPase ATPase C chain